MPRPRRLNIGTAALGALIGGSLGGNGAAAVGGLVGGAVGAAPPPLAEAIAEYLRDYGMDLVSLRRIRKSAVSVVFQDSLRRYWSIDVVTPFEATGTAEELDDRLYDAAKVEIEKWRVSH